MLKLLQSQRLGFNKINYFKGKSAFVVLPIAILFGILVFAASQAKNITTIAHNAIFSPIQGQNEIIELSKNSGNNRFFDILNSSSTSGYTTIDTATVSSISNVEKAGLVTKLPIDIIKSTDLFDSKTFTIDSLAGLDSVYATLYTNSDFTYAEGKPIPIILNANDFVEVYQDWQGKNELSIEFSSTGTPSNQTQGPVKARAIVYSRDQLLGKTFTITFGGLQDIQPYTQEATKTGFKYVKKSDKTIASEIAARKTAISKYWDYTKISTPISYTFVVAGISEGSDKTTAYIPADFASKLMSEYLNKAITSRNKKSMPASDYNLTYVGLVYDGVTLQEDATTTLFAGIRNSVTSQVKSQFNEVNKQISTQNSRITSVNSQIGEANRRFERPPGGFGGSTHVRIDNIGKIGSLDSSTIKINFPSSATSYAIPGLVYKKDRTTNAITGEYKSFDFTKALPLSSNAMLVKLANTGVREQVVSDLNTKGFNYTDYSKYRQFETLEQYINLLLTIASASIVAVTGLFVLINMAKFVSESKKEIGIFRAIGASKGDISMMFLLQSLSYIFVSLIIGGLLGIIAILTTGNVMVSTAQTFITKTLGNSLVLTGKIGAGDFVHIDVARIGIYALGLILVTLIVSLIPANQATKVSPVEAIRNN